MRIQTRRFRTIFTTLLLAEILACGVFIASRPSITSDGWAFLERQRPKFENDGSSTFMVVADGLNFAIFRRPLGGWESAYGHLFQLFNIVPCLASFAAFQFFQMIPFASSKVNSDAGTIVFCGVATIEFAAVAALFSLKRHHAEAAV